MPPLSYIYWLLLIVWVVFGFWTYTPDRRDVTIGNGVVLVLFILLGLMVGGHGPPR